jgi:hypothetical protein
MSFSANSMWWRQRKDMGKTRKSGLVLVLTAQSKTAVAAFR